MAIKSIISSGAKTEKFQGAIMKVGAGNTMKLTRDALVLLLLSSGGYVFVADDSDDANVFYVAGSQEERSESGAKGSKLGIVGDKESTSLESASQLQFSHALLGKKLHDVAAVFEISEDSFDHDGLKFHTMTVKQSRADYEKDKAEQEAAKQAKVDSEEDNAANGKGRARATVE